MHIFILGKKNRNFWSKYLLLPTLKSQQNHNHFEKNNITSQQSHWQVNLRSNALLTYTSVLFSIFNNILFNVRAGSFLHNISKFDFYNLVAQSAAYIQDT